MAVEAGAEEKSSVNAALTGGVRTNGAVTIGTFERCLVVPRHHHVFGAVPTVLNHIFGVDLKRAPAVNTLRTILHSLEIDALEALFRRHAQALLSASEAGDMLAIALDGKTLRGSFDHLNDQKAAQTLTTFASPSAIVLAHTETDEKSRRHSR